MLRVYNTLTRKKEELVPLNEREVKIYTCGVTVYDDCHIGHGRSLYIFEVVRRYLEFRGFKVTFVRNITDVDDKIMERAQRLLEERQAENIEEAWRRVVETYIRSYYEDLEALGLRKAEVEPRASECIKEIIEFVRGLIDKGFAYQKRGSVYFKVRRYNEEFGDYGKLSGKTDLEELRSFVRIEEDFQKEDPLDFALWKEKKPHQVSWLSPWGEGRPGWHIECSVMSTEYLGSKFDIHGGGKDLIFPHHENEIAQAKALLGKDSFARYWMHHGLITVQAQKMSKSLGNFITLRRAIRDYSAQVLKVFFLSSHYASPLDFTPQKIKEAGRVFERINIFYNQLRSYPLWRNIQHFSYPELKSILDNFTQAMDEDFNMPAGFSCVFKLIELVNNWRDKEAKRFFEEAKSLLYLILNIFCLLPEEIQISSEFIEYIEEKIELRKKYRLQKKYREADLIRKELLEKGVILEDLARNNTRWRLK